MHGFMFPRIRTFGHSDLVKPEPPQHLREHSTTATDGQHKKT